MLKLRYALIGVVCLTSPVLAQTPVKRISGYRCMMLNISESQAMDPHFHVSLRSQPSSNAAENGWAGSIVIVREPLVPDSGFLQVLKPNGERAWISAAMVKPYRPVADPSAKCIPEVLPNGRIGTGPG